MDDEKRFRIILDKLPISIYITNIQGKILFANEYLYKMLKVEKNKTEPLNAIEFYKNRKEREQILKNMKEKKTSAFEYKLLTFSKEEFWVRDYVYKEKDKFYGVLIDITNEKKFKEKLIKKDKFLSIIANNIQKLLTIPYEEDILENIAKTFCEITESDKTTIIEFLSIEDGSFVERATYKNKELDEKFQSTKYNFTTYIESFKKNYYIKNPKKFLKENKNLKSIMVLPIKDKENLWGLMLFENFTSEKKWDEKEIDILKIGVDILGVAILQRKMVDKLLLQSILDDLTGLHNRRGFFNRANNFLNHTGIKEAYLFFIDFDNLKKVNDKFGHKEGDKALKTVSKILKELFRKNDIVARIGGDEFVILTDVENFKSAKVVKKRINKKIEEINNLNIFPYKISVSIGMAKYDPLNISTIDELLILSDEDMYREKKKKYKNKGGNIKNFPPENKN